MVDGTTTYEAIANAIGRAMADTADGLPQVLPGANQANIDQALADIAQAATDAANAGIDTFIGEVDDLRTAIEDLANEAFGDVDALVVRTLQSNLPRTFAFLVLIEVIDQQLVNGATRYRVDWERLQGFVTDPGSAVNEAFWSALLDDLAGDPHAGRMIAVLIALLIMAPQTIIALARGDMSVASLPELAPGANADPVWANFLTATADWLSLTVPLPDPTKTLPTETAPNPPDRMVPASLYELIGGIDPNIAVTLAFRSARSAIGGQDRTDFETWVGVSLEDDEFEIPLGKNWKVQIEPGFVFGFGYAGRGDRNWHASLRQFLPGGGPAPTPDDEVTVRLYRDMPAGTPDLLLGPPYDTRLEVGDLEVFLHLQEATPVVELGFEVTDAAVVVANRWFRFFGQTDTLFREGIRLDIEQLRLAYAFGEGVRFNLAADLSTILVFDWQIGKNSLNVTLHSLSINIPLNFDLAQRRYEASAELRLHLSGTIGPVLLVLNGIGLWAGYRQLGDDTTYVGFLPPTGAGASINLPAVSGGAYLDWTGGPTDRIGGVFYLRIYSFSVTAFGIYERLLAEPGQAEDDRPISLIMVIGVTFQPGIQLGFGIAITGFGGIVGINRKMDTNALLERLTSGAALNVLFPDDPIKNAPTILRDLEAIFPGERETFVVGPTMQLTWIGFARADLGVVLQFPGPSKIAILGVVRAEVPGVSKKRPLLQLRIDFVGIIDVEQKLITFDASLISSKAFEFFHVTGDAAFRLSWGEEPYTVLSLGGFHPEFDPAPAVLPEMTRIALTWSEDKPYWLRFEAYLAVTSNTFQVGGKVEAGFKGGGFQAIGWLALDVLIQFSPFHFSVSVSAGFKVRWKSLTLVGVRFSGTLSGPGPIKLTGKVCIEILFFDICWKGEIEFGDDNEPATPAVSSVASALQQELSAPANIEATGADDPLVAILRTQSEGPEALISPVGGLRWTQNRVPLATTIERFEGAPLVAAQKLELSVDRPSAAADDWFAPGSFIELKKSEALNRPSFERLTAGADVGLAALTGHANPVTHTVEPVVIKLPKKELLIIAILAALPAIVIDAALRRHGPAEADYVAPIIGLAKESWSVAGAAGTMTQTDLSATEAHQRARYTNGIAVTTVDHVALSGV